MKKSFLLTALMFCFGNSLQAIPAKAVENPLLPFLLGIMVNDFAQYNNSGQDILMPDQHKRATSQQQKQLKMLFARQYNTSQGRRGAVIEFRR